MEQAGTEVVDEFFPCDLLEDSREHVGCGSVVDKDAARFLFQGAGEERPYPIPMGVLNTSLVDLVVARSHGEQVFDGQAAPTFIEMGRELFGEVVNDPVVTLRRPSSTAIPMAVAVKLLLKEYRL